MTNSKNTKRALLASLLSLVLCCAMLIGSTFAWFTDSVTSGKNVIAAGNLSISATVHDLEASYNGVDDPDIWNHDSVHMLSYDFIQKGDPTDGISFGFSGTGSDLEGNGSFMSDNLFEPGKTYVKMIRVKNNGSLAVKIKPQFHVEDGGLQDALWFAIAVGEQQINRNTMSGLVQAVDGLEGVMLLPGWETEIVFAYGMDEEAGNEYQGKSFGATVSILATQYTYEEDSFDDQYDKEAVYPTVELASLKASLKKSGPVILGDDFVTDEDLFAQGKPAVDLNGKTVRFTTDGLGFKANGLTSVLTINGDGIVTSNPDGEAGSNIVENDVTEGKAYGGYTVTATNNSKIVINGGHYVANVTAVYATSGGKVEINGGFFDYIRFPGSTIKSSYLLNLKDNTNSSIVVKGGTFVNFDPSNNTAEGPDTNFVAEGYEVIPETQANGDIWYTVVPE